MAASGPHRAFEKGKKCEKKRADREITIVTLVLFLFFFVFNVFFEFRK